MLQIWASDLELANQWIPCSDQQLVQTWAHDPFEPVGIRPGISFALLSDKSFLSSGLELEFTRGPGNKAEREL